MLQIIFDFALYFNIMTLNSIFQLLYHFNLYEGFAEIYLIINFDLFCFHPALNFSCVCFLQLAIERPWNFAS